MTILNINLSDIKIDCGTQSRVKEDQAHIDTLAEAIESGETMTPAVVFDDNKFFYMADGHHRYKAFQKAGKTEMPCIVKYGTLRDAQIFAFQMANINQKSLPLSVEDKRARINFHLDDLELQDLPSRDIAERVGCSHFLVNKVRREREEASKPKESKPAKLNNVVEKPSKKDSGSDSKNDFGSDSNMDDEAIAYLQEENRQLENRLAVAAMDATPEEKTMAKTMLEELQERIKLLEIENQSLKTSRDMYQAENAQLKKQVMSLQRQVKKAV